MDSSVFSNYNRLFRSKYGAMPNIYSLGGLAVKQNIYVQDHLFTINICNYHHFAKLNREGGIYIAK